jgi:hypothetical protein
MRITTLVGASVLTFFAPAVALAFDAAAPDATAGMSGGPAGGGAPGASGVGGPAAEMKPNTIPSPSGSPSPSSESDPAERSAKSIECSQKAEAQGLHGKPRRRFMHECKHGA